MREIEKVPCRKIEVIRNGIDLERFPFTERPRGGIQRRAIHVARISYAAKDQRTLLSAVRIVADVVPDFVIDIVGDGDDRADLEAFCDKLGLRRHVNFLGFRDDVHNLLSQAEFFVLSSVTEGVSITLLEAAANGLPIVATAVGGNAEVVVDAVTGILVPPQAPAAARRPRCWKCSATGPRALSMGLKRPQGGVEEVFDLRRTVERYKELYRSLISGYRSESRDETSS